MAKLKKLSTLASTYFNFPSGATLSLIKSEDLLPIEGRKNNKENQKFANIIAGNRKSFTQEYISKNQTKGIILKSDKFMVIGKSYIEVGKNKKNNPHHHIKKLKEIEDRLDSIINSQKK